MIVPYMEASPLYNQLELDQPGTPREMLAF